MGLISHRIHKGEIADGDHIYTWRAVFAYSHHGIFVGGSKVVHFTRAQSFDSTEDLSLNSINLSTSSQKTPPICPNFPDCGFQQPNSSVILSCLDCFLGNGSLYRFEYGVGPSVFLAKLRGGTCTTAESDPVDTVIHRAMYLLQNGFGNYDVFKNNCEDFALYCKTGLLVFDQTGLGRSGQAACVVGAPLAALLSSPLRLFMSSPVGVATATAGVYCMSRYATDIGVRNDVVKVKVEDLPLFSGCNEEVCKENESFVVVEEEEELVGVDEMDNPASKRQRLR